MATPTPAAAAAGFKTENTLGTVSGMTGTVKQHFHVTNDTKAQVETAGYFNPVADFIGDGDLIVVSGDRDGTKWHSSYVATKPGSGDLTVTQHAAVTQNVKQVLTARVPVLGTASTHYLVTPIAGAISKVLGVSNANGAAATGTVTITVPTTGAIATLSFVSGYTAGAAVEDTTITAHSLAAGAVVTVATDGGGDGTGEAIGMAWMNGQSDPVAAWRDWRAGRAEIAVARDGVSTRVALNEILGPQARAAVEKSFMENLRSTLSLEAAIATASERSFKERSDAVWSDLSVLAQDGGLSLSTVEAAKGSVEPERYLALRELAKKGGPSVSDGGEIARLSVADSGGIDIREQLRASYAEGKLAREDFVRLYDRNAERLSRGVQNPVAAGRDYVGNSLGKLSSELGLAQSV